jgi:hypothetical protein
MKKGDDSTEKWVEFYRPFFATDEDTFQFVKLNEDLDHSSPMHPAKIMMHQTQRLVSLADDLPTIRPSRDSLQLLFLVICAENIAKLHDNFAGEGKSRFYVQRFFTCIVPVTDRDALASGFVHRRPRQSFSIAEVADLLYDIRCDVVHEGMYWGFFFRHGDTTMMNVDPNVNASISLARLRDIVVRGCISAIRSYGGRKAS